MTPALADSLRTAKTCLIDAAMLSPVPRAAAREAYLAAYHAAEAYVFHCTGKIAKTHSGLRSEFNRLAKDEPRIGRDLVQFLSTAYELKSIRRLQYRPRNAHHGRPSAGRDRDRHAIRHRHRRADRHAHMTEIIEPKAEFRTLSETDIIAAPIG
jgi:uncharacterized protein (UPF0332 family)